MVALGRGGVSYDRGTCAFATYGITPITPPPVQSSIVTLCSHALRLDSRVGGLGLGVRGAGLGFLVEGVAIWQQVLPGTLLEPCTLHSQP